MYKRQHGGGANHDETGLSNILGLAPAKARYAAFQERIHKVILPSLAELGVPAYDCLLYTSDAADERSSVDLGGRRIIKKNTPPPPHPPHPPLPSP